MPFVRKSLVVALALSLSPLFANAADLPAVPAAIKDAGVLKVGVRCDQPPYGYQDNNGDFAGVEVEAAKQVAEWALGSKDKAALTCVTSENRIPQLLGRKVDMLVATLGVTPERQRVIDFTKAYRWGASDVLVKKDSGINSLDDLKGKTLVTLKGTVQAKWFEDHMPDVKQLRMNSVADALGVFRQGRADAYTHDGATLVVVTGTDDTVKLINEPFQISDAAIGIRKGEDEWKQYLDAAIDRMREQHLFRGWIDKNVQEKLRPYYYAAFEGERPVEKAR